MAPLFGFGEASIIRKRDRVHRRSGLFFAWLWCRCGTLPSAGQKPNETDVESPGDRQRMCDCPLFSSRPALQRQRILGSDANVRLREDLNMKSLTQAYVHWLPVDDPPVLQVTLLKRSHRDDHDILVNLTRTQNDLDMCN